MAYTTIDNPELFFQTKIYTADQQANRLITLDGSENMQPDWVWLKNRNSAVTHDLYDSVRGVTKYISSNQTTAEATNADGLVGFNTDGFTVDTSWGNYATGNGYVAWCWKAGTSFSNDASATGVGSLDSSGSVSTTAGFSIISYTGSGSAATIAHGLGSTPQVIIIKNRSSTYSWEFGHSSIASNFSKKLKLDTTSAEITDTGAFNNTAPTSSVFTVGNNSSSNGSGNDMIAYCFAEKKGYSKFSSYVGNGSSDGPFINLGFRPAWIMFKRTDSAVDWTMYDNKRIGYNPNNYKLRPNLSNAEYSTSGYFEADMVSNGFKIRTSDAEVNTSGGTYIYMAFAESSFVSSSGIPTTAR